MRNRVAVLVASPTGCVLRLTEAQIGLIKEVLAYHFYRGEDAHGTVIELGVDRKGLGELLEKVAHSRTEFSMFEIHVLYASLISTPAMISSDEAFYEMIGYFRENALGLARGLLAVGDAAK